MSHGLIIGIYGMGLIKLYFDMVWVNCVREQRWNSASLAQASPSRLSESCKTSFLVCGSRCSLRRPCVSVERHVLSLRREWLA